ncbi:outer membrane lipoprotein involved in outer membrane biogenesis [Burkholderiales bacterium JOSHI_001]|nr:outer membrane lipoprotein involved in outer membrane biogenesis [Burkholderiales bacterium JOSHI_001]
MTGWPGVSATRRGSALALAALVLGGCVQVPPRQPAATDLSGRLAVRVDDQPVRQWSAAFELSGNARHGQLNLVSPLGTVLAQARWSPGLAELVTPTGTSRFASLDQLGEQALGERIPLAALFDWLRGLPWADAPWTSNLDNPSGFEQLGWRVDLSRLAEGAIEARRDTAPVVTVRARLDR